MKYYLSLFLLFITVGAMAFSPSRYRLYVDDKLQTNSSRYTFHSVNEALLYVQEHEAPSKKWTEIHIAPSVYWIDDPDDETVHMALPGDHQPYGLKVRMSRVRLIGLSNNAEDVVLASRRGQTQGAVGNFTMLHIEGSDIEARNITFGNYCNVDLVYPRDPQKNRTKRSDAIVQAQLIICNGDNYKATNCRFISRLNLCPFAGARHADFQDCYFECTDDALCGTGIYRHCKFTFFSSKPFYATSPQGAHFYDCDIHAKCSGTQYLTKRTSLVTMENCRWTSDDPELKIEWARKPSPDFACFTKGCTLNGKPLDIPTPTEPLPLELPAFPVQSLGNGPWVMDAYVPKDIPQEHMYKVDNTRPAWGFAQGVNGGEGKWGLVQQQKGARIMYPSDKIHTARIQFCPNKEAGQGFGSATAQYMDVCIKFDCSSLTGYGIRYRRTPQYDHSVEVCLVRYDNGTVTPITEPQRCDLYKPSFTLILTTEGNTLKATMEHNGETMTLTAEMPVESNYGGFHLQHTGSNGDSATLIENIEFK